METMEERATARQGPTEIVINGICMRMTGKLEGSARQRPLWLADVDGVINSFGRSAWRDTEQQRIRGYTITYSPQMLAEINEIGRAAAEIRWLTSWGNDARTALAPALGLDEFPVHAEPSWEMEWKYTAAVPAARGEQPVIWTDDDAWDRQMSAALMYGTQADLLLIQPDVEAGLSPAHLELIRAFTANDITSALEIAVAL